MITFPILFAAVLWAAPAAPGVPIAGQPGDTVNMAAARTDAAEEARFRATIRRTAYGVAHIEAADLASLGFGEGYAQAEDHVCTIAAQILMARGEQAKYLGRGDDDAYVMMDVVLRAVGFPERGWKFLARQPPEIREWLEGFAAGYNRYLAVTTPGEHPEWCREAEWVAPIEPRDLAAYVQLKTLHTPFLARQILRARPPEQGGPESSSSDSGETLGGPFDLVGGGTGASNGWAVGRDLSASGRGMLVANPHVSWTGSLRMWEKHLTIPGELDVYGVNRIGLPGVLIGFNEHVAWTHTVSPAASQTLRALELIPGAPTRYRDGDRVREMTAREVEVEVRGFPEPVRRTVWLSHRGPITAGPGFPWTTERAYTLRDVNDDDRAAPLVHLLGTARARSLDELRQVHREHQAATRLHTLATDASGEVWYVHSSAVPHLSAEALEVWRARAEEDPLIGRMAETGVGYIVLGSDPLFDEVDAPEAARPGIVPFRALPELRRTDYVFNANDSHWLVHGEVRLDGRYSPFLNGGARILSLRSRNNVLHLEDRVPGRTFRTDGRFTFEGLKAAILSERSLAADLLVPDLVRRCRANPRVVLVEEGAVDLGPACSVLEGWDRDFGLASRGAVLFREWMGQYEREDFLRAGRLFAEDFDPGDPVNTPRGLASGPLALENLARALRLLERQDLPLDVELGSVQYAGSKLPSRIPVPGAMSHTEGGLSTTRFDIRPPTHEPLELPPEVPGSRYLTEGGYPVLSSHGLLLVVEFTDDGPRAEAILAGGQSGNPDSEHFRDQTELYSRGEWRPVLFRPEDVAAGTVREYTVAAERRTAGPGADHTPDRAVAGAGVRLGDGAYGAAASGPDPARGGGHANPAPHSPRFEPPRFEPAPCPFEASAEVLEQFRCGYVTVPENRSRPDGRKLRLAVAVPEGLRSVVLDGPLPPNVGRSVVERNRKFADALSRLFARCAEDPSCNAAFPDAEARIWDVVEGLDRNPMIIRTGGRSGLPDPLVLRGGNFAAGVRMALYSRSNRLLMPLFARELAAGNETFVLEVVTRIRRDPTNLRTWRHLTGECYDRHPFTALPSPAPANARGEAALARAGMAEYDPAVCEAWHPFRADRDFGEPVVSATPALILTGEFDPVTHRAYGPHVAVGLDRAQLVEIPGGAHVEAIASPCATRIMLDFLNDPELPVDKACLATMPPLRFLTDPAALSAGAPAPPGRGIADPAMPGRGHEFPGSCTIPLLLAFFDDPQAAPDGSCVQELPDVPFALPSINGGAGMTDRVVILFLLLASGLTC
jgi:acyl-homoserine-lactone acylase